MTFSSQQTSEPPSTVVTSWQCGGMAAGSNPAHAKIFISFSYFLEFSFYYNMQLIQLNVYFNHYYFQIILLSYITRYSQFRKCE